MKLRILRKPRRCDACGRTVTPGKKHKANRRDPAWCRGYVPEDERRARKLYVAASHALAQLATYGPMHYLEDVCRALLKGLCIDPEGVLRQPDEG